MHRHPAAGSLVAFGLILGALSTPAGAQTDDAASAAPAHIAVIDGVAVLERAGRADPASVNVPLVAGDRVRTERGRLEILFADGSALDLDQYTALDIESDTLLRLLDGRLHLTLEGDEADGALSLRVDTPGGSVDIRLGGEYRVSLTGDGGPRQVELKVVRGVASLVTEQGAVGVGAGQRAVARAGAPPSYPYTYNSAAWDAFDRWSDTQRNARLGVASAGYLPGDLQAYGGTFDRFGQWRADPSYGYVLVPERRRGLAAVLQRPVELRGPLWLDLDRRRRVVVAHAPLRPLGLRLGRLVLDPRPALGRGVGLVALGVRLRGVVPARLRRRPAVRREPVLPGRSRLRPALRATRRLDGAVDPVLRPSRPCRVGLRDLGPHARPPCPAAVRGARPAARAGRRPDVARRAHSARRRPSRHRGATRGRRRRVPIGIRDAGRRRAPRARGHAPRPRAAPPRRADRPRVGGGTRARGPPLRRPGRSASSGARAPRSRPRPPTPCRCERRRACPRRARRVRP